MNRFAMAGRSLSARLLVGLALASLVAVSAAGLAGAASSDDRTVAESILTELERNAADKALAADPIAKARSALDRAGRMRTGGDEAHARLADGLARDWAETARDLVGAAAAEGKASATRRDALDAGSNAERERALLEETFARIGRLRAQLEDAERERSSPEPANVTSTATGDAGTGRAKGRRSAPAATSDGGAM